MSPPLAPISCAAEIYPFEGGPIYLSGGQIRAVTVSKTLLGGGNGTFSIELAPGGPYGPESAPDWTEIITPGSHVLIGMQRGADAAIVLDGVSTLTAEDSKWSSTPEGSSAMRSPVVTGADFCWFFNAQNWYSLAMYGLTAGTLLGGQLGYLPSSLIPLMSKGIIGNGSPVQVGQAWFETVMAGSGGMLGSTFVPYRGGNTRLPFNTLVSETLEQYPGVYVPLTTQFLGLESWMAKFMEIFPWPWYEFFVTTAPSGVYGLVNQSSASATKGSVATSVNPDGSATIDLDIAAPAANVVASGRTFSMQAFPTALPAGPQMVARVNPVPRFDFVQSASGAAYTIGPLDMTRWNALPLTQPSLAYYESQVGFSSDEAKNFYMLNPTAYQTMFGNNGSNVVPFPFAFAGAADPASVHRYGYRPVDGTTSWFYDWQGTASQKGGLNIVQSVATLTAALASWWHPLPLMLRGESMWPLMPNVYIGTRFEYPPFKDGIPWTFYVEGVTHRYAYGGHSSTTLSLTRGLPSSIYADASASGLLQAIYTGNARRQYLPGQPGIYQIGLPSGTGQGLQVFSSPTTAGGLAQQMCSCFVTPQTPSN
jgi:hypothetical protein